MAATVRFNGEQQSKAQIIVASYFSSAKAGLFAFPVSGCPHEFTPNSYICELMNDSIFVKTALHYGALSGIGSFIFYMLLYFTGFGLFGSATLAGIWIPVLFIVLAIKFHRNENQGGFITFGKAFMMGLSTTLFSSALFALLFYLFGTLYDPGIVEMYKNQAALSLEEGKSILSEAMYEKALDSIDMVTLSSLAFSEAFNKILGGMLITLFAALIMKRKQQPDHDSWQ